MGSGRRLAAVTVLALTLAAPVSASRGVSPGALTDAASLTFTWPAQGTITTPFILHWHDGIDIGMLRSLTVRAAAAGTVELVGQPTGFEGYGNIVLIRVTSTIETLYAHLSSWSVKPGDTVVAGQPIGIAGCTGICTGTHLHFEVRDSGVPVNPLQFLN
ncbi:MAG: M23 family metallopeptidase [Actinobacteria bacterium]|nr:M23 family metallopeptidase [Actinomycetota bacterium]MBV8597337.1 M23 family metallopeptidase [Actinomycetota bacterium]